MRLHVLVCLGCANRAYVFQLLGIDKTLKKTVKIGFVRKMSSRLRGVYTAAGIE